MPKGVYKRNPAYNRGKKLKEFHKKNCNCTFCNHFGKNNGMYGKHHSQNSCKKIRVARKKFVGKHHPKYLSDAQLMSNPQKYSNVIHSRMYERYGKANHCESQSCNGKSKSFEWSNKDHKYGLKRKDWQQLCQSCHQKYDLSHPDNYWRDWE